MKRWSQKQIPGNPLFFKIFFSLLPKIRFVFSSPFLSFFSLHKMFYSGVEHWLLMQSTQSCNGCHLSLCLGIKISRWKWHAKSKLFLFSHCQVILDNISSTWKLFWLKFTLNVFLAWQNILEKEKSSRLLLKHSL